MRQLTAIHRLASYGTLAPGRPNAHLLDGVEGCWHVGTIRGHLVATGWGNKLGYPGIRLDCEGASVEVHIFQSVDLPDHWDRLDAFEGEGYRRTVTTAMTDNGELEVCVYELAIPPSGGQR